MERKSQEKREQQQQQQQNRHQQRTGVATTVRIDIDRASAATVWSVVTDIGHKPEFVPCIESVALLGDRQFKVGLQWKEHRTAFPNDERLLPELKKHVQRSACNNNKEQRQQRPFVEQLRTVVRLEDDGNDSVFPKSFSENITNGQDPSFANTNTWTVYPAAAGGADESEESSAAAEGGCILLLSVAVALDPPRCAHYCCCCVPTARRSSPRLHAQKLDFLESYCTQELRYLAAEAERREEAAAASHC